jgi:hypothetical protein
MKTADIITPARRTLRDNFPSGQAHTDDDFIDYLNRALSFIAVSDSSASVTTGEIPLVQGSLQKLPATGIRLLKIFHNNLANTLKSRIGPRSYRGRASIKNMSLLTLMSQIPNWAGTKESAIAIIYCFNTEDPESFIVYPPNTNAGKLVASYSTYPVKVTVIDGAEDVPISEKYSLMLIDLVIAFALSRDTESASNRERAKSFMSSVAGQLGLKDAADTKDTPADTIGESDVS